MYKLQGTDCVVKVNDDGSITTIPIGNGTAADIEYAEWLVAGNTPLPADQDD